MTVYFNRLVGMLLLFVSLIRDEALFILFTDRKEKG